MEFENYKVEVENNRGSEKKDTVLTKKNACIKLRDPISGTAAITQVSCFLINMNLTPGIPLLQFQNPLVLPGSRAHPALEITGDLTAPLLGWKCIRCIHRNHKNNKSLIFCILCPTSMKDNSFTMN